MAIRYVPGGASEVSPGSVWSGSAWLADLARDVRASRVDDLVTILVAERAARAERDAALKKYDRAILGVWAAESLPEARKIVEELL